MVFGGQSLFTSTGGNDAETIANMQSVGADLGDSYAIMAIIYNILPPFAIQLLTIFIGLIFITITYKRSIRNENSALLFFLLFVPIVFTIATFQKDLILVLFIAPVYFIIQSQKSIFFKIFGVVAIYAIYGLIFRSYYFLIIFFFLFIIYFKNSNNYVRLLSLILLCISILILPESVYYSLQSSRDIVNEYRMNISEAGNRTAFTNPLPPTSFLNFIFNYFYAVIRLNFGFFFTFGFKDILFVIYPLIYYYYSFKSLYKKDINNFLAGSLIVSHSLVYFLFEPDTGSYARHLASTLPYLAIIINSKIYSNSKINSY